jgi:hypothetical protein
MPGFSRKNIKSYFSASDKSNNTTDKGRLLEDLVCYLFEQVPGVSVGKRNTLNTWLYRTCYVKPRWKILGSLQQASLS